VGLCVCEGGGGVVDFTERCGASDALRWTFIACCCDSLSACNQHLCCTNRCCCCPYIVLQAMILVERETQVPIILGRGAAAMKKLGSASRQQIEEFLGRPVYLELGVQVHVG